MRLGQRWLGGPITDEVRPGISGDLVHRSVERCATPSIAELTIRVIGMAAGSIVSPCADHSSASACAAAKQGSAKSFLTRRLGRAVHPETDETSISLLRRDLLVEPPGQGFVEIPSCHGNGIGRLGRPGEGFAEIALGGDFSSVGFLFAG